MFVSCFICSLYWTMCKYVETKKTVKKGWSESYLSILKVCSVHCPKENWQFPIRERLNLLSDDLYFSLHLSFHLSSWHFQLSGTGSLRWLKQLNVESRVFIGSKHKTITAMQYIKTQVSTIYNGWPSTSKSRKQCWYCVLSVLYIWKSVCMSKQRKM